MMKKNKENHFPLAPTYYGKAKLKSTTLRVKTQNEEPDCQFNLSMASPSEELKSYQPLLQNRRIPLNHNKLKLAQETSLGRKGKLATNIEQLKKEIKDLQKDDFFSFRQKMNEKLDRDNLEISKFNMHNSFLMDLKGNEGFRRRPQTTLINKERVSTPVVNQSSVPRKYYSKAKQKKLNLNSQPSIELPMSIPQKSPIGEVKKVMRGRKKNLMTGKLYRQNHYRI